MLVLATQGHTSARRRGGAETLHMRNHLIVVVVQAVIAAATDEVVLLWHADRVCFPFGLGGRVAPVLGLLGARASRTSTIKRATHLTTTLKNSLSICIAH